MDTTIIPTRNCVCSPGQVQRYLNKISGPLLDRIDIQIEIVPVPFEEISKSTPGESSACIRERVIRARQIQAQRFANEPGIYSNAQMTPKLLHLYAQPDAAGLELLRNAMNRLNLSARAYDRILRFHVPLPIWKEVMRYVQHIWQRLSAIAIWTEKTGPDNYLSSPDNQNKYLTGINRTIPFNPEGSVSQCP